MRKGFLKEHHRLFNGLLRLIDAAIIAAAGLLAFYLSLADDYYASIGQHGIPSDYVNVILLVTLVMLLVFPLFSVYRVWRALSTLSEIRSITMAWSMVMLIVVLIAFMGKISAEYSRSWAIAWYLCGWVGLVASRVSLRLLLRYLRANGFNHRHIVIVGTGEQASVVADRLRSAVWFGLDISAMYGEDATALPTWLSDITLISEPGELRRYVTDRGVDQVWIALPHSEEDTIREVIRALDGVKIEIRYVPDIFEYQLMHHHLTEMAGIPVVNISYSAIEGSGKLLKMVEDYLLSTALLVLASPAMLLIALGIKLSSSGPVLYRQKRVGWNGKEFTMLKFRTMPVDVEKLTGPVWAQQGEQRATGFGAFLRKTSLDELPQLFNVLMGEMSLIGPRPERPVFVEKYREEIPHYNKKHLVKAGMTGWAQVHGWRGNTCLHTRIEHDLYYIENWSLWLDIRIIIMTVFRGLIHKNAY